MASEVLSDEQNLAKQVGCMAGFFHIFDRHQFVTGKRIYGPRRIPSFSGTGSSSPSERSDLSVKDASETFPSSPIITDPRPVIECKDEMKNSWKLREGPRLSLDSRLRPRETRTPPAIQSNEESDKCRRSPSVVARLMGLDALPNECSKRAELRRSSSESRVSRDLQRFNPSPLSPFDFAGDEIYRRRPTESKPAAAAAKQTASAASSFQRKGYFNALDLFPEPDRIGSGSLYGEIEKRLRMRGIHEPAKDLETLKQVFEALKLKGLLHSTKNLPNRQIEHRPIVVMKPGPRPNRRSESARRAPVQERRVRCRSPRSPDPNSRRPVNNVESARRISSAHSSSPKSSPRRMSPDTGTARSPRNRRSVRASAEDDTATSVSVRESEYSPAGRSLLERCDKLLHSIAAFTSAEQVTAADQQPSPVSVLDSFEDSYHSPVMMKRCIDLKGPLAQWEDDAWVPSSPTIGSRPDYVSESEYAEFAYVSNVVLASDRHQDSPSLYSFVEKRHMRDNSRDRRLMFDAVVEIVERKRHWCLARQSVLCEGPQLVREVWAEVRRVREDVAAATAAEDVNAVTCGAIRKDMACGDHGWSDASAEVSDTVLGIERLVFKDLVGEMIRDLADIVGAGTRNPIPRRKLLF